MPKSDESQLVKACVWCGKEFLVPSKRKGKKHCSWSCMVARKAGEKVACPVCSKPFSWSNGLRRTCSNKCYGLMLDLEEIERIEEIIGESMGTYLRRRYVKEQATIKELEIELGLPDNMRRFKRWLARYGIEPRGRSETVKLVHAKNPRRGVQFGLWAASVDVRQRQARARQSMPKLSGLEKAARAILLELGLSPVPQYAVHVYNIDFALPDLKIGIEIDGGRWHDEKSKVVFDRQRDEYLAANGWTIRRFNADQFGDLLNFGRQLASQIAA